MLGLTRRRWLWTRGLVFVGDNPSFSKRWFENWSAGIGSDFAHIYFPTICQVVHKWFGNSPSLPICVVIRRAFLVVCVFAPRKNFNGEAGSDVHWSLQVSNWVRGYIFVDLVKVPFKLVVGVISYIASVSVLIPENFAFAQLISGLSRSIKLNTLLPGPFRVLWIRKVPFWVPLVVEPNGRSIDIIDSSGIIPFQLTSSMSSI